MRGTQYIPPRVLEAVGRVFDFGARKHAPFGWINIADYRSRYGMKILRHAAAYFSGEMIDPESGESHIAHLIADAMIVLDRDMRQAERDAEATKEVTR